MGGERGLFQSHKDLKVINRGGGLLFGFYCISNKMLDSDGFSILILVLSPHKIERPFTKSNKSGT